MEEHFILRVPQSVAERLERVLNENPASASDELLDLAFKGQLFLNHFNLHILNYIVLEVAQLKKSALVNRTFLGL